MKMEKFSFLQLSQKLKESNTGTANLGHTVYKDKRNKMKETVLKADFSKFVWNITAKTSTIIISETKANNPGQ